jgi:hypothetical protein
MSSVGSKRKGLGRSCAGYRPLFCGAASGLPELPEAAYGFAGLADTGHTKPPPNHQDQDRPAAHKWCTPARTCFALRGHVLGAMSSESIASFGCRRYYFTEMPSGSSDSGPASFVSAPSPVPRAFKASKGRNRKRRPSK